MAPARYVLSYGCGVNTAALMILLLKEGMPFDEAVFADTGGELPETYEYLAVSRAYLERHGKPLTIVRSRAGTLYDTCVRRTVIPSQIWRWSTRDYKIRPIHRYYRSLGVPIHEYLGIAYDEVERMKKSTEPYITSHFPLVDRRITREGCMSIIKRAGLPVPVKSGCFFCPFNNIARWKEIHDSHPELYAKAVSLEEGSKHYPNQLLHPVTLRKLALNGFQPVNKATLGEGPCGAYCMT